MSRDEPPRTASMSLPSAITQPATTGSLTTETATTQRVTMEHKATSTASSGREDGSSRFYRPELDALRFFAFFGVFIFHAFPHYQSFYDANTVPRWLSRALLPALISGAYGVDVFFALSAYLITSLLLRERATTGRLGSPGTLDLRGFYLRRILRIWPLYLSFVAFAALAPLFMPVQKLEWQYIAGYSLLAGNWVYVFHGLPAGFTIPLWTVSIEEQFYLTWPIAVRKVSLCGMAWIAATVLLVANATRVWLAISGAPLDAMEYNTFTRLDPIALGILLALVGDTGFPITAITLRLRRFFFPPRSSLSSVVARLTLTVVGVAALVGSAAFNGWHNPENPETWRLAITHPLIALGSAAILMAFIGARASWLRTPALLYLGRISYGLYVVHVLGLFCAERLVHPASIPGVLAQAAVGLALTVALAAASYRWLETPFLRLKERFAHVQSRPV